MWVVSFTPQPLYSRRKSTPYPFDRRLSGPQCRSWTLWRRENSWSYRDSNTDPSVVRPVASRHTDCAIAAPLHGLLQGQFHLFFLRWTENLVLIYGCRRAIWIMFSSSITFCRTGHSAGNTLSTSHVYATSTCTLLNTHWYGFLRYKNHHRYSSNAALALSSHKPYTAYYSFRNVNGIPTVTSSKSHKTYLQNLTALYYLGLVPVGRLPFEPAWSRILAKFTTGNNHHLMAEN
jgi:hypothetical protein